MKITSQWGFRAQLGSYHCYDNFWVNENCVSDEFMDEIMMHCVVLMALNIPFPFEILSWGLNLSFVKTFHWFIL